MPMSATTIALARFGLGARPDEEPPADPKAWLAAQLGRYEPDPPALAAAPDRAQLTAKLADYVRRIRGMSEGEDASPDLEASVMRFIRTTQRTAYLDALGARTEAALVTPAPFVERLVHFWANHFAVSADKLQTIGLAGLLELEAVRANVLGRFGDMLLAVERHPAMLLYLDQAQSIGPGSRVGRFAARRRRRGAGQGGLNENLAREILELHTLGVRTVYTQADVTELARAMTGWTVGGFVRGPLARIIGADGAPGEFVFAEPMHEPGRRTVLGKSYGQKGEAQARAILADLAVHPATAKHVATKLARHFVADAPPPALVTKLERAFLSSGGDLPTVYRALIEAPEAWQPEARKFKAPWDWAVSALRGVGSRELPNAIVAGALAELGQPPWRPGSPAGWDDSQASWAGPDALVRRVEVAEKIAARAGDFFDPRRLAERLLPGSVSPGTAQAIARADSPPQGIALLLVSPEFQRR